MGQITESSPKRSESSALSLDIPPEPGAHAERAELYGVLRAVPAMVAITQGPGHHYEFANPLYLQVLGKTEAIIGKSVQEVFPELKGQGVLEILDRVYRTGKEFTANEHEIQLDTNNDGTLETVYFNFVYQAMRDADGKVTGIMSHAVEVSAQVNARRKAEENETRYRTLFNSIDEGFCVVEMIYDESGRPVDYRFVETNKVFEDQTGLKLESGKSMKQLLPNIEDHWIERYGKVALTGKSIRFTEGSAVMGRWFDVHASRVGGPDKHRVALLFKDITQQKKVEMQQQAVTSQITEVLESMGDAFFMLDKDWKFVRVNKVHEKVTKTKRKEIIGKYFWDVFPDTPDSKYWIEHHKVMETRKPSHFIERYAPLDLWTEVDVYPTSEGGISVFFRDITASKKAAEALQQSEERFRTLIEQSVDVIQLVDAEGKVLYTSDSMEKVLGYKPAEILGVTVAPYIHPDDWDKFSGVWAKLLKKPKAQMTLEYRVKHKDGSWIWIETTVTNHLATPNINAVVGNFRNISKRKQAEEALKTNEEHFRFMAESLPQKVFTADSAGKVTYFNPQWSEYLGVPPERLIKEGVRQYIHPDDLPGNMRAWKRAVKTGKAMQSEQRLLRADGQYRRHVSHVRAMHDKSGNIVQWFGSMTDIEDVMRTAERNDELEKITAALKEQRAQLIELGKAKDEFISLASHQLRTPATGVKQYLGMVLEEYAGPVPADQRKMLNQAYASNEREIAIINDLLKVAQVDAGKVQLKPRPADVGMLLEEIIDGQQSKFDERGQKVDLQLPASEVRASLDPERIRMVLENIVDNASKYTPAGNDIRVKLSKSRGNVIVAVRDQGVGIPKKDIDKLFRKFTRLDNPLSVAVGGTGLGLYWAKKIVDLHGGTISVDSTVGEGSTFTVTIPAHE